MSQMSPPVCIRLRGHLSRRGGKLFVVMLAFAPALAFAQANQEPAPRLAPHRAVYDLSLLKTSGSGGAPAAAAGRIAYDFSGSACDGYKVEFRQLTELTPMEGVTRTSDMRSTTFESGDHKTFRFRVDTLQGERVTRVLEGKASRSGDGALSIELSRPEVFRADTAHEAIFPTDLMIRAIAAARKGEATLAAKVYDGSDSGDKVYETLSVIGRPETGTLADPTRSVASMKGMRRWRTTVSYFDTAKVDEPPVYLLSFDMWDNGVSSDLVLDYGEFQLKGEMTKLEMLPQPACDK